MNTRAIKAKIKGVKNTKKITKAMEMIAATKMRKAIEAASKARDYTALARSIVDDISLQPDAMHPLLGSNESVAVDSSANANVNTNAGRELIVIIAANRGLCGSYNSNVATAVKKQIEASGKDSSQFAAIAINKKAGQIARRLGLELVEFYQDIPEKFEYNDILPIVASIRDKFVEGGFTRVNLAFTEFVSSMSQRALLTKLLPLSPEDLGIETNSVSEVQGIMLEPESAEVINFALSRILEVQFFQAFLEASASEHSSRMVAMKNATDSAGEIVDSLTLEYNKSRQAAITQEIAEISNAAAAMQ